MWQRVKAEFSNNPMAVVFGGISCATGIGALIASAGQSGPGFSPLNPNAPVVSSNYLIAIAAFIGISVTAALLARFTYSLSRLSGCFGSVIFASLSMFLVSLVFKAEKIIFHHLKDGSVSTASAIYWGTSFVFLTLNAELVLKDYIAVMPKHRGRSEQDSEEQNEAMGDAALLALVAAAWLAAVAKGQSLLSGGL
ncbi:hypothetical protein [Sphingobium sp. HWE2-09]|uniref:hypothetical protein n=1 Tax=Sphingobium sp. HWE2-09 TaxID=3108390 RepID=UPI002DD0155E|nr:hypothetical protein [Sphingobium sp. HWE2-09]